MKVFVTYKDKFDPPVLVLFVHGAPHRRMHRAVFDQYRKLLIKECEDAGIIVPIKHPLDLKVYFINPTSPDLGNIYLALEMCLDAKSRKGVVADDSLIGAVDMKRMYT